MLFCKEASRLLDHAWVGVTAVHIGKDLGLAKVYLSFLNQQEGDRLIQKVNSQGKAIRKRLGYQIARKMHKVPSLQFYQDHALQQARRVVGLIQELEAQD